MTIKIPPGYVGINSPEIVCQSYSEYLNARLMRKLFKQNGQLIEWNHMKSGFSITYSEKAYYTLLKHNGWQGQPPLTTGPVTVKKF